MVKIFLKNDLTTRINLNTFHSFFLFTKFASNHYALWDSESQLRDSHVPPPVVEECLMWESQKQATEETVPLWEAIPAVGSDALVPLLPTGQFAALTLIEFQKSWQASRYQPNLESIRLRSSIITLSCSFVI